jgi:hypothetical protein
MFVELSQHKGQLRQGLYVDQNGVEITRHFTPPG